MAERELWLVGFVVVAALVGVGSFLFLSSNKDAALKRKVWRIQVPLMSLAFGVFLLLWLPDVPVIPFLVVIAVITFVNLRTVKFCDHCGATAFSSNWLAPLRTCPECGGSLTRS